MCLELIILFISKYKSMFNWLAYQLSDWVTSWLNNWLIEWLCGRQKKVIYWLNDWLTRWLFVCMNYWLIDWVNCIADWITDWLIDWVMLRNADLNTINFVVKVARQQGKTLTVILIFFASFTVMKQTPVNANCWQNTLKYEDKIGPDCHHC